MAVHAYDRNRNYRKYSPFIAEYWVTAQQTGVVLT